MRPALEVADIFRQQGYDFRLTHPLSPEQRRVMRAIEQCRTAALGGHVDECDTCGHQRISYNSCRNRHCPKCQSLAKARWLDERMADLLPVEYFHVVFTLAEQLASLALQNKRVVYNILFATVAQTLRTIAADPKHLGAELGFLALLHTWGQNSTTSSPFALRDSRRRLVCRWRPLGQLPQELLSSGQRARAIVPSALSGSVHACFRERQTQLSWPLRLPGRAACLQATARQSPGTRVVDTRE